ncbi:hypothetical protein VTN77DRAFT_5869 [Rasamsonia byssochlamydoides]|uniref:uncharacterized protein n=1 Tax=Rasamsonia byssochlamydoides TaxID=89139 RepID=UPI0037446C69
MPAPRPAEPDKYVEFAQGPPAVVYPGQRFDLNLIIRDMQDRPLEQMNRIPVQSTICVTDVLKGEPLGIMPPTVPPGQYLMQATAWLDGFLGGISSCWGFMYRDYAPANGGGN